MFLPLLILLETGAVALSRPGIILFNKVVLPAPDGPVNIEHFFFFNVFKNFLNADKEKIEQNILHAIKKAHELSTTTMKERMNDLTGGLNLNLPGFDNSDS